jgi:hypothetical protein
MTKIKISDKDIRKIVRRKIAVLETKKYLHEGVSKVSADDIRKLKAELNTLMNQAESAYLGVASTIHKFSYILDTATGNTVSFIEHDARISFYEYLEKAFSFLSTLTNNSEAVSFRPAGYIHTVLKEYFEAVGKLFDPSNQPFDTTGFGPGEILLDKLDPANYGTPELGILKSAVFSTNKDSLPLFADFIDVPGSTDEEAGRRWNDLNYNLIRMAQSFEAIGDQASQSGGIQWAFDRFSYKNNVAIRAIKDEYADLNKVGDSLSKFLGGNFPVIDKYTIKDLLNKIHDTITGLISKVRAGSLRNKDGRIITFAKVTVDLKIAGLEEPVDDEPDTRVTSFNPGSGQSKDILINARGFRLNKSLGSPGKLKGYQNIASLDDFSDIDTADLRLLQGEFLDALKSPKVKKSYKLIFEIENIDITSRTAGEKLKISVPGKILGIIDPSGSEGLFRISPKRIFDNWFNAVLDSVDDKLNNVESPFDPNNSAHIKALKDDKTARFACVQKLRIYVKIRKGFYPGV